MTVVAAAAGFFKAAGPAAGLAVDARRIPGGVEREGARKRRRISRR